MAPFNNEQIKAGGGGGGGVTSVSATLPLSSTGGTTPNISETQAGTGTDGWLSSTDWNTFNNKLTTAATTDSVTGNGTSGTPVKLVNDAASPGNSQYYGTDIGGTKGYHAIPPSPPSVINLSLAAAQTLNAGGTAVAGQWYNIDSGMVAPFLNFMLVGMDQGGGFIGLSLNGFGLLASGAAEAYGSFDATLSRITRTYDEDYGMDIIIDILTTKNAVTEYGVSYQGNSSRVINTDILNGGSAVINNSFVTGATINLQGHSNIIFEGCRIEPGATIVIENDNLTFTNMIFRNGGYDLFSNCTNSEFDANVTANSTITNSRIIAGHGVTVINGGSGNDNVDIYAGNWSGSNITIGGQSNVGFNYPLKISTLQKTLLLNDPAIFTPSTGVVVLDGTDFHIGEYILQGVARIQFNNETGTNSIGDQFQGAVSLATATIIDIVHVGATDGYIILDTIAGNGSPFNFTGETLNNLNTGGTVDFIQYVPVPIHEIQNGPTEDIHPLKFIPGQTLGSGGAQLEIYEFYSVDINTATTWQIACENNMNAVINASLNGSDYIILQVFNNTNSQIGGRIL